MDLTIFLRSSAVDWVRKGAADKVLLNPLDRTMIDMVQRVRDHGCTIMVCRPCAKFRRDSQDELLDGVVITGLPAMHALIKDGASTLRF